MARVIQAAPVPPVRPPVSQVQPVPPVRPPVKLARPVLPVLRVPRQVLQGHRVRPALESLVLRVEPAQADRLVLPLEKLALQATLVTLVVKVTRVYPARPVLQVPPVRPRVRPA